MRMIALIAAREYAENVKTKGFWIGILAFPLIFAAIFLFQARLSDSAPTRHYLLIDQSPPGEGYGEAVQAGIQQEHQRQVMQAFVEYVMEYRRDSDLSRTLPDAGAQVDDLVSEASNDEVAAMEQWLSSGGVEVMLRMVRPMLREDAPDFVAPEPQFVPAEIPASVDPAADPAGIVEQLRPYLTGERRISTEEGPERLFALILIPRQASQAVTRPGAQPLSQASPEGPEGIQYWASNLTDTRLSSAVERSVNREVRNREFADRGVDVQLVQEVQRTRMPMARLDPKKAAGEESVSLADTFQQWAPMGFVYLIFISLMTSVQYLLSNTVEEKANRIIEVLLASVTPGELMMGKLLGIGLSGLTTIAAWLASLFLFITLYPSTETAVAAQILEVLLSSELIPFFIFYYLAGYALYSGIFLAIGSLCNTLKEAQSLMTPMMLVLIVPIITMTMITQDPNGSLARIMSWIPLFTPFTMMNRAAAEPPLIDTVGTTLLLIATVALVLWLCGRVFRAGVLRTGQPPRLTELFGLLRTG